MTEYVLLYDVRDVALVHWRDFVMLPVVAAMLAAHRARGGPRHPGRTRGMAVAVVLALAVTGMMAIGRCHRVMPMRERLRSGGYQQVQGRVQAFVPATRDGAYESWQVRSGGRTWTYMYRPQDARPGLDRSDGRIREGVRVRLADVDGHIARLEAERGARAAPPRR